MRSEYYANEQLAAFRKELKMPTIRAKETPSVRGLFLFASVVVMALTATLILVNLLK